MKSRFSYGGRQKSKRKHRSKGRLYSKPARDLQTKFSDETGHSNEQRALDIAKTELKELFKREENKGKEKVEFIVDPYISETRGHKWARGKDIKFALLLPLDLKGKEIIIEVKSSEGGKKRHESRGRMQPIYRAGVVVVNEKRTNETIALCMFDIIKQEIKKQKALAR